MNRRTAHSLTSNERKFRHRLKLTRRGVMRVEVQLSRSIVAAIDKAAARASRSRAQELAALITAALRGRE